MNSVQSQSSLRGIIEDTVRQLASGHTGKTRYREPIFGYADAMDPAWETLRDVEVPGHLLPAEVLPGARSVACFFLPFAKDIVQANAVSGLCADEWAIAYIETNALLADMCAAIRTALERVGVPSAWQAPTHNYDPELLRAAWSHKSAAVIAGMGAIGLHQMLITPLGCAGRVSSVVVGADLGCSPHPSAPHDRRAEFCGFYSGKGCSVCLQRCPAHAIKEGGLDKKACKERLKVVGRYLTTERSIPGAPDICGKCCTGPCAFAPYSR